MSDSAKVLKLQQQLNEERRLRLEATRKLGGMTSLNGRLKRLMIHYKDQATRAKPDPEQKPEKAA
jgi:hypothetical protein